MDYLAYPKPDREESGCKVGWLYYKNRLDAEVASTAARHNALIDEARGYDFGFQSPGQIMPVDGMYRVTTP